MDLVMRKHSREFRINHAKAAFSRQKSFLDSLELKSKSSILDVGCGVGLHMEYFANRGLVPVGLDGLGDVFIYGDSYELIVSHSSVANIKANSFDYVFSSHVLEHCGDPYSSLLDWIRWLKPGGG